MANNLPVFKKLNQLNKAGAKEVSRVKRDDTTSKLDRGHFRREYVKLRSLAFICSHREAVKEFVDKELNVQLCFSLQLSIDQVEDILEVRYTRP